MSHLPRIAVAVAAMVCALLSGGQSLADDDTTVAASETFRAAAAAFERGDFEAAARSFEVSHRLAPHPNSIYNAGRAWLAAGRLARAADALTEAAAMPDMVDEQLADAQARLAELAPQLVLVHVVAPPGTRFTLAHASDRQTPASMHLMLGTHAITATFSDGRSLRRQIEATAAGTELDLALSPAGRPVPPPKPALDVISPPAPAFPAPDGRPTARNQAQWVSGWILVGASVLSGGIAIGLGVEALRQRDAFVASRNTDGEAHDQAATLRTATNVMWGTTGALGLTGVLLLVFAGDDGDAREASTAGTVGVAPSPGGLAIIGHW